MNLITINQLLNSTNLILTQNVNNMYDNTLNLISIFIQDKYMLNTINNSNIQLAHQGHLAENISSLLLENFNNNNFDINIFRMYILIPKEQSQTTLHTYEHGTCINAQCALCLRDFNGTSRINVLPCRHGFCSHSTDCLGVLGWLHLHHNCPICRQHV